MATLSAFSREPLLVGLAASHGLVLLAVPWAPVIAVGVWWSSNTVAHHSIHRPLFRTRGANRLFSLYLSLLLGIPQSLWKQRHLAHHAETHWRLRLHPQLLVESAAVLGLWTLLT
ncbi:MAG: fatty acid desaturase, partial [bacterium]